MDNKQTLVQAMTVAAVATGKELTQEVFTVYWELLQEYPIEDVDAAFRHLAKTSKWFPKVAEIIDQITPAEPDTEQVAIAEWDSVVLMLKDSRNARSSNPITERVVKDLGGYWHLGNLSMDELKWQQREFVRRYVMHEDTTVAPIHRRLGETRGPARIGQIVDDIA